MTTLDPALEGHERIQAAMTTLPATKGDNDHLELSKLNTIKQETFDHKERKLSKKNLRTNRDAIANGVRSQN